MLVNEKNKMLTDELKLNRLKLVEIVFPSGAEFYFNFCDLRLSNSSIIREYV